jgi:hypothetical protein
MAETQVFRFFDLPAELREVVFKHLLLSPDGIDVQEFDGLWLLDIFLVNMQMYQEASAVFYGQNQFTLDLRYSRLDDVYTKPGSFMGPRAVDARRRIRRLRLLHRRVGGDFEKEIDPILTDMVLSGSLRGLDLRLDLAAFSKRGPSSRFATTFLRAQACNINRLMTTSPYQALFRLLADPDLQAVELWTFRTHFRRWCDFHDECVRQRELERQPVGHDKIAIASGEADWIQLDWRAMVATFWKGVPITKVGQRNPL